MSSVAKLREKIDYSREQQPTIEQQPNKSRMVDKIKNITAYTEKTNGIGIKDDDKKTDAVFNAQMQFMGGRRRKRTRKSRKNSRKTRHRKRTR